VRDAGAARRGRRSGRQVSHWASERGVTTHTT
jgi:hypothetical protein